MKRILFVLAVLVAAAALVGRSYPDEFWVYVGEAVQAGRWVWDGIQANPLPVSLAAGTFLLTVVYHKAKGKSLRESLEVAATRVTVVSVPQAEAADENPVVKRAKARATRAQLLVDQIGLQNRQKKLPEEVLKAEKDACYTELALIDAERKLADRQKAHEDAVAKLEAIRGERDASAAELAEIDVELQKLADLV
jgi:predicted acylesterase/phospholipase RssA